MSFFQTLSPAYLPATLTDRYSLQALRERILQTVLLFALVFGLPLTLIASYNGITNREYYLPFIYIPVLLAIAATASIRKMPYTLRGQVVTSLIFLLAVSELSESGQIGEVRMILLAYVALTAAFFSYRQIIFSILLSLGVIIGVSLYVSLVPYPFIPSLSHVREGTFWPVSSLTFLMLSSVISGAFALLIDGLGANLKKQAALSESIARERDSLEERVSERTQGMQRRIIQLRTAAEISRVISRLNDTDDLLQQVADLVKSRFELYYVGIFLVDPTHQFAVLQAGTGEAGVKMRASRHQLTIRGNSMVGWCITNRRPRIALDVGLDAVRFNNPNLPLTRSELALPIIAYDQVLGAISIQSAQPNAFDENDITILEGVSHSLAIALENNRLYNETRRGLEEIRALNHEYLQQAWAETIERYGQLSYEYINANLSDSGSPIQTIQVPLQLRDTVIGQIEVDIDRPALSQDEMSFLDQVSAQTALALENARLLYDTERRALQEEKLNELTSAFSRAVSIDEILRAAAQEFGQLPAVVDVAVHLNPPGPTGDPACLTGIGGGKEHA